MTTSGPGPLRGGFFDYKGLIWEGHHHRFGLAGEGQADTIERFLEESRGAVLSVGCGPWGRKIEALAKHCYPLTAIDREIEVIRHARGQAALLDVHLLVGDALGLPFHDRTFGHIVALGLFVYIAEPEPAFREFHRVCRTGGHLFVTNAVRHPQAQYERAAAAAGFTLIHTEEGYCPAASGDVKRRYLLVFQREEARRRKQT